MRSNKQIAEREGLTLIEDVEHTGINSRIAKGKDKYGNTVCIKQYRESSIKNDRWRIKREVGFLKLAEKYKIREVPKLLTHSKQENYSIIEWRAGKTPDKAGDEIINNYLGFFKRLALIEIERERNNILYANESCKTIQEHFRIAKEKLDRARIRSVKQGWVKMNDRLRNILNEAEKVEEKINKHDENMKAWEKTKFFLSPSDVGIHNILKDKNNISYIDFEYSGWDDAAKMISDWSIRPENILGVESRETLKNGVGKIIEDNMLWRRTELVNIVGEYKWIAIIINKELNKNGGIESNEEAELFAHTRLTKYRKEMKKIKEHLLQ